MFQTTVTYSGHEPDLGGCHELVGVHKQLPWLDVRAHGSDVLSRPDRLEDVHRALTGRRHSLVPIDAACVLDLDHRIGPLRNRRTRRDVRHLTRLQRTRREAASRNALYNWELHTTV